MLVSGLLASLVVSGIAVTVVVLSTSSGIEAADVEDRIEEWIAHNAGSPLAILGLLLPAQVVMLGFALLPAAFSREGILRRLGFRRGPAPLSTIALAVLGSLGVQFAINVVAGWLIEEPSQSLRALSKLFSGPSGLVAVLMGFMISVPPGFCEELFFRGYGQRGLLRGWPPALAIGVTSFLFALAHFDVQHSPAVFPLGLWFGFVAWRTGAVWPAMLCHFANNLVAFVAARTWGEGELLELPEGPAYWGLGAVLLLVTGVATVRLMRTRLEGG